MKPIILDVFGGSGSWSDPYREAGYDVQLVDITMGRDVLSYHWTGPPAVGVLLAPPCTEFAGSGARWWAGKDPALLNAALALVHAALRLRDEARPRWWALENPVGRLARMVPELGPWSYTFQPYEYGDNMKKRTCIWGDHVQPSKNPIEPTEGADWVHRMAPGPDRAARRSITPPGFARAFYLANP